MLVLVLVGLVGMLAVMHEAERGRTFDLLIPLGLAVPLALIGLVRLERARAEEGSARRLVGKRSPLKQTQSLRRRWGRG